MEAATDTKQWLPFIQFTRCVLGRDSYRPRRSNGHKGSWYNPRPVDSCSTRRHNGLSADRVVLRIPLLLVECYYRQQWCRAPFRLRLMAANPHSGLRCRRPMSWMTFRRVLSRWKAAVARRKDFVLRVLRRRLRRSCLSSGNGR
jgi:hypothetical protein